MSGGSSGLGLEALCVGECVDLCGQLVGRDIGRLPVKSSRLGGPGGPDSRFSQTFPTAFHTCSLPTLHSTTPPSRSSPHTPSSTNAHYPPSPPKH